MEVERRAVARRVRFACRAQGMSHLAWAAEEHADLLFWVSVEEMFENLLVVRPAPVPKMDI